MPGAPRVVLITGCSSGIGRATALRLARSGHTVYASARRRSSIEDLEREGCRIVTLDVTDDASMTGAVGTIEAAAGPVEVLVNNAGYGQEGALETLSVERLRDQFETNVFGMARLTQLVLPGMRGRGWGRIVNVSSLGGRVTFPGGGAYHASKHAVEAMSDALRFEVRHFGVDVVIIEPGLVRTPWGAKAAAAVDDGRGGPYDEFNRQVSRIVHDAYEGPMGRFGSSPDAVARVIERCLDRRRPRPRYVVPVGARALIVLRKWLPDRAFDALLRTRFPSPGAEDE